MVVTRASPIISAEAVAAVRRGLRRAFSRASTPTVPNNREKGQAITVDDRPADHRAQQGHPDEDGEHAAAQRLQTTVECQRPHHQAGAEHRQRDAADQSVDASTTPGS